jgi:ubiquinone/menaquinone biosynthesis C-methylase UbiE
MGDIENKEFLSGHYTGKEAEDYDYNREVKDIRRFAEVKKQIKNTEEFLRGLPDGKILDVACGTGRYFKLYGKREIHGVDISEDMLKFAKEVDKKAVLKVADGEHIPYGDNSFDIVITSQFIQHIPDYLNVLKEMGRVCKKRGHLIVDFPNRNSLSCFFRFIKRSLGLVKRPYNFFTEKEISKISEDLNLEIVEVRKTIFITPVLFPKSMVNFSMKLNDLLMGTFPGMSYKNYVLFKKKEELRA